MQRYGIGRLVVVLDDAMNRSSIAAFGRLAQKWDHQTPPLTVVAGARARVVKAFGHRWQQTFYNHSEYLPLARLMGMLPWAEIWIVKDGMVWSLRDGRLLADLHDKALPASLGGLPALAGGPGGGLYAQEGGRG